LNEQIKNGNVVLDAEGKIEKVFFDGITGKESLLFKSLNDT
jgi:hypothetical protein